MSREEFMNELEYLLQDIPDEEKRDAIEYYRDYLDEAGPEMEEQVIHEFGSPERIAALIRSDLSGHLEDGGEFTENGYEDPRFKDPNYQVAKRYDLPEERERQKKSTRERRQGAKEEKVENPREENKPWTNSVLKVALIIVLVIAAFPVLLGVGGGMFGLLVGLAALLLSLLLAAGALTLGAVIAGVALVVFGVVHMAVSLLNGVLCVGLGLAFLGVGWLLLALSIAFYGKFIPWVIGGIVNFFNGLINGGRRKKKA